MNALDNELARIYADRALAMSEYEKAYYELARAYEDSGNTEVDLTEVVERWKVAVTAWERADDEWKKADAGGESDKENTEADDAELGES